MPVDETDHPSFARPDPHVTLWRYVDLAKYLSLISTQTLWFCRSDLLGDPFEGSMSLFNVNQRPSVYDGVLDGEQMASFLAKATEVRRDVRQSMYVNCWHCSKVESAAMWSVYSSGHGIAVLTSYDRMRRAITGPQDVFVGHVKYIDYESTWIPEGNLFDPFLHKRVSFEHEKEVRAVHASFGRPSEVNTIAGPFPPDGIAIVTDAAVLISEVRVSPAAPSWFAAVVTDVTHKYGLECAVKQSELDGDPVY